MSRPEPADQASRLNALQAWLLGHIDTPTLHDRLDDSPELSASYGRVIADPAYAAALMAEAQHALEEPAAGTETPEEQAYAMYQAAIDAADEARLLAQEEEGQPAADEREERASDFRDACCSLGLPATESEPEADR